MFEPSRKTSTLTWCPAGKGRPTIWVSCHRRDARRCLPDGDAHADERVGVVRSCENQVGALQVVRLDQDISSVRAESQVQRCSSAVRRYLGVHGPAVTVGSCLRVWSRRLAGRDGAL